MDDYLDHLKARRQAFSDELGAMLQAELATISSSQPDGGLFEVRATFIYAAQELARQAAVAVSSSFAMGMMNPKQVELLQTSLHRILDGTVARAAAAILKGDIGQATKPKHDEPVAGMSIDDILRGGE